MRAVEEASSVQFTEEELCALVLLAKLRREKRDFAAARGFLDRSWEAAESGPYPAYHCDALIVDALLRSRQGDSKGATTSATKVYTLAWCDGPPYAYHQGLKRAGEFLRNVKCPMPTLPRFEQSRFSAIPSVELNPKDEFHV